MSTETPPVAVCTRCGDISYRMEAINNQCGRQPGGKRCKGTYGSALSNGDWAKCRACGGSGKNSTNATCPACQGTGWNFVRDRRL
jgi:hypothetical protein